MYYVVEYFNSSHIKTYGPFLTRDVAWSAQLKIQCNRELEDWPKGLNYAIEARYLADNDCSLIGSCR